MLQHTDPGLHAARRARYLVALGSDAALLASPPHHHRNADTEYRYRQASDLFYLTGWEDPEAVALFRPGAEQPFILFVQPRDPEREVWTGRREGVEGAVDRYGADVAYPIAELPSRLGALLFGYSTLHCRPGEDAALDRTLFTAVRGMARPAARNGGEIPWRYVDAGRLVGELRLRKEPAELDLLREAARISCEAHRLAMGAGRAGVHEYEIEAIVDGWFRRNGGNGPGYTTIVGGGANACILHYVTNRDALRPGWRGHGLGSRLLAGVLERMLAAGTLRVALAVASNNHRAIGVYRTKFGFRHEGILENEFNTGQAYHLLRLELADWAASRAANGSVAGSASE